ncbi:GNAT family N-acetyltransferase [Shewanella aestuarii]|uniref:GNAT family N-acetyltransferase n=1 Tax=Shewanella aestuarii TaxID=1028752 RepID=A0A6G9QHR4_9GAMM|nr:GNAT family N-acetyltransferase [Shewanella aestuarii]
MTKALNVTPTIRPITQADNAAIAAVIRQVSAEYGLTPDKGFGVADKTLDTLYQVYDTPKAQYWVIELDGKIVGGAGIAPLAGNEAICELQKMYFSQSLRGKGMAKALSKICFDFAAQQGYQVVYLETTAVLVEALALYQKLGFSHSQHLGQTGHDACEIAMIKTL